MLLSLGCVAPRGTEQSAARPRPPASARVISSNVIANTDGDGLPDDEDFCPTQCGYLPTTGCPSGAHGPCSGVADAGLPDARSGAANVGSAAGVPILRWECFAQNSTAVPPSMRALFDEVARLVLLNPTHTLLVEGIVDSLEPSDLALARIRVVEADLQKRGVEPNRLGVGPKHTPRNPDIRPRCLEFTLR